MDRSDRRSFAIDVTMVHKGERVASFLKRLGTILPSRSGPQHISDSAVQMVPVSGIELTQIDGFCIVPRFVYEGGKDLELRDCMDFTVNVALLPSPVGFPSWVASPEPKLHANSFVPSCVLIALPVLYSVSLSADIRCLKFIHCTATERLQLLFRTTNVNPVSRMLSGRARYRPSRIRGGVWLAGAPKHAL